jgi:hypothetical protein
MKRLWFISVILIVFVSIILIGFIANMFVGIFLETEGDKPRTFLVKLEHLELVKELWKEEDPTIEKSMNLFLLHADRAMKRGPFLVNS